jgi:hypothetical protein
MSEPEPTATSGEAFPCGSAECNHLACAANKRVTGQLQEQTHYLMERFHFLEQQPPQRDKSEAEENDEQHIMRMIAGHNEDTEHLISILNNVLSAVAISDCDDETTGYLTKALTDGAELWGVSSRNLVPNMKKSMRTTTECEVCHSDAEIWKLLEMLEKSRPQPRMKAS